MENVRSTFDSIIESLDESQPVVIGNQTFLNEIILDKFLQCSILAEISFFEINFKQVDFTGSSLINCRFKNCTFEETVIRKCKFWNSVFENCQFEKCNLTRVNFTKGNFQNCRFINGNLNGSDFLDFEFIQTKINNTSLDCIGAESTKVWKLNQCIEIKQSFDFGKFLKNLTDDESQKDSDARVLLETINFLALVSTLSYLVLKPEIFDLLSKL